VRALALLLAFFTVSAVSGALMSAFALPLAASTGWAVTQSVDYFNSLPADLTRPPLPQRSVVLAADGSPITYFYDENRSMVPLAAVAPVLQQAVVAIEDSRFYGHGGVDIRGMARAVVNDSSGGQVQGASTLTQQYVKNVLLEQAIAAGDSAAAEAAVARTPSRKLREARLAIALESRLSKQQILEHYLNIAYLGGHTYGVQAAAQRYFGLTAATLTLPQAATLAGMISEPASYDPQYHPSAATQRRNVVLARMLAQGMITKAQFGQAVATPMAAPGKSPSHGCTAAGMDTFFCDYVLRTLLVDPSFGALGGTQTERMKTINRGGLVIRTTLDAGVQYAASQALEGRVPAKDPSGLGAATVTVEPGTGRVLAMTQNRTYSVTAGPGLTSVNYSTDGDVGGSTGFQTGSSFKPFTLAAWLADGRSLDDTVDATQRAFPYGDFTACGHHLRSTKPYEPGNSEGTETGKMTVLEATFNSVNVAYVDMESQLDLCDITGIAERLGMHLALPGAECGEPAPTTRLPSCVPSLTLGVKEIAPLTMAAAYAGFASGGVYCRPLPIAALSRASTDQDAPSGAVAQVAVPGSRCSRAIPADVAHGVTAALTHVLTEGTAAATGPLSGWPSAGKTGTTDGPYDSWFVGYTPQRSTSVWVADPGRAGQGGNVNRRQLTDITVGGRYYSTVFGASIAAPIWKEIMNRAMEGLPSQGWP
jgi:membrane peptidoglycan carboxypeptidase